MTTLYTPVEAAQILKVDPQTVKRYARAGRLKGSKPGGRLWRFSPADIDEFLADSAPAAKPTRKPSRRPNAR
jgi:excisionase family DNA binding protein